jgi:hypothetical protein
MMSDNEEDEDPQHDHYYKFLDGVSPLTAVDSVKKSNSASHPGVRTTSTRSTTNAPSFGYSDIPNSIPMPTNSHFPIGSAVAIYQLAEQGKLDNVTADVSTMLDRQDFENFGWGRHTIRKLCPQLSYGWSCQRITLEHLLSMSSSIYPELKCQVTTSTSQQCNPTAYILSSGSIAGLTVGTLLNQPLTFRPGTVPNITTPTRTSFWQAYFVEKYVGMTFRD